MKLRSLERHSGLLPALATLLQGEMTINQITGHTDIFYSQLYKALATARDLGLVESRIDSSSYPSRNFFFLTSKGKKVAELLRKIEEVLKG